MCTREIRYVITRLEMCSLEKLGMCAVEKIALQKLDTCALETLDVNAQEKLYMYVCTRGARYMSSKLCLRYRN